MKEPQFLVTTFRDYKVEAERFFNECGRMTTLDNNDTLIVALTNNKPIGIVRLCFENQTYVLRTMQILPEVQRKGFGTIILNKFDQVLKERNIDHIFCMTYEHLETFYNQIGFKKIIAEESPQFLQDRFQDFLNRNQNKKIILMKRHLVVPNKDILNSLPRKRNAVGLLIFKEDKILVVKPTYKSTYLVPGGIVETLESLADAANRECSEEIGVKPELLRLLVVDYKSGNQNIGDAIHFLFSSKLQSNDLIKIDNKEIESFLWVSPEDAYQMLEPQLAKRVAAGLEAIKRNHTVYCENGNILI